jgi:hypothetical protein
MSVSLSPVGGAAAQFFTNTGSVLTGGKLYTYAAGTTTPETTYTSANGATAWSNPIVLDAAGRVSGSGEIWLTVGITYKFVLKDSNDVLIGTYDNVSNVNASTVAYTPGVNSLLTSTTVQDALDSLSNNSTGSSVVGFIQSGTGAVATNVEDKLREIINVKDFGAVCDGVTDDTVAIQTAIVAARGKTLFISGTPLISATITFAFPIKVIFDGPSRSVDAYQNSYFIKKNGVNFTGVVVTTADFVGEGGGVQKQNSVPGATAPGYGVHILGVNCNWYNLSVFDMGSTGIRIGEDTGSFNTNGFCLIRPTSTSNGGYGIHIADNVAPFNCNAGTLVTPQCQGNTLDGIFLENTSLNTIVGPLLEANKRWGLNFAPTATQNTVIGGDSEANNKSLTPGVKDIWIQATAGSGFWGQTIINTVVSAGGGGPYLVNDDLYSTILGNQNNYLEAPRILVPSVKTTGIVNSGSVGPTEKLGTAWGSSIPGTTTNARGYVNVAGLSSLTLFTLDASAGGQAVFVYISQGIDSHCAVALVVVPENGTTAIVTELYKTNADWTVTASGLNVQVTNAAIGLKTAHYSVIRFA